MIRLQEYPLEDLRNIIRREISTASKQTPLRANTVFSSRTEDMWSEEQHIQWQL